jgi:hypothetical protein
MPSPNVLLFDLDAVLLNSEGYYESLRRAVEILGAALGFAPVRLSQEDIDVFESLDITAEWDSSALCAALLLDRAWEALPDLTLPERPPLPMPPLHGLPPPDFRAFALSLAGGGGSIDQPLARAHERLLNQGRSLHPSQVETLDRILIRARDTERSLTFHLIQELNLGSVLYAEHYHRAGVLGSPGMLATRDLPTLSAEERGHLAQWLGGPNRHAAIVTNRPSRAPGAMFNTPEAEIGIRAAGMDGMAFVASGALGWFAERQGLAPQTYLKPSPVHLLAGLRLALDHDLEGALAAAQARVRNGPVDALWRGLDGATVAVFEDAAKGMRSALAAKEALASGGVRLDLTLYGITRSPAKARVLENLGARVFDTLSPALEEATSDA